MFIERGRASGTVIGVEAIQVGTVPIDVDGETIQEPIYNIARCEVRQNQVKRIATLADKRVTRQIFPSEIAGDLTVTFVFRDGEQVVVSLDESRGLAAARVPIKAQLGVFLPTIKITWRDRSRRGPQ